ncbi:MAG TPA: DUF202 domain-containing protein [Caulobacteraceae bacterium]|nr:DUF202 domain-containing protein [Caulobacteraceae bacterium]
MTSEPDLRRQTEAAQSGAERLEANAGAMESSADRRTELAADRTVLAAERTYAAWVRTGLAALASGVGGRTLLAHVLPGWFGALVGSALIAFSAFCFCAAVWRELAPGAPPPPPDTARLPTPLLLVMNGFLVFVSFAALVGMWVARL